MKAATIGVGSNSVRMLIAAIEQGQIKPLVRDRAGTRLFASLDETGNMNRSAMEATLKAVEEQCQKAREFNADEITVFATSAVRDATNKHEFCSQVLQRTGINVQVLSGHSEAVLSFLGAVENAGYAGVIDIGGGSTEVVIGKGEDLTYAFSHQMGAVRLYNMHPIDCVEDIAPVMALVTEVLKQGPNCQAEMPDNWIGVGGTFTTLAAIVHSIEWTDTATVHGRQITRKQVYDAAVRLAPMTRDERVLVIGMRPQRADIVVHGMCILLACMDMWGIDAMTVSENGNLNGFLYCHYAHLFTENLHN